MSTHPGTFTRHPALCRATFAFAFALATLPLASPARADLGAPGGITVSAERLFGYAHTNTKLGSGTGQVSGTNSEFAVLLASPASMYSVPRIGLDVSIGNGLTVGGAFGFAVGSSTTGFSWGSINASADSDQTTFVLAPRAGYALALGEKVHLWGRGGFTYFQTSLDGNTERTINGLALTLEPTLVYMSNADVGITASLTFDLPLSGERKEQVTANNTITRDNTYRQIGLLVGFALDLF